MTALLLLLLALSEPSVSHLPKCPAIAVRDTKEWISIDRPASNFSMRIPPDMKEFQNPLLLCMHGCEEWARDSFHVLIIYGVWDKSSFGPGDWSVACVDKRDNLTVVRMIHENSATIWVVQEGSTADERGVLLTIRWTSPKDAADANAIIASIGRAMPRDRS